MNEETIKFHKMIGGKLYPLEMRRQRFEQTVDRIDKAVEKGATITEIRKMFADHIVSTKAQATAEPAKVTTEPVGNKQEIVAKIIAEYPDLAPGLLIKKIAATGAMTAANARYLVTKALNKAK